MLLSAQSVTEDNSRKLFELAAQAAAKQNSGDYEEAERLHRAVLDEIARIPDFPSTERARQLSNLASVLNLRGKPDEALNLLKQAQSLLKTEPSDDLVQYSALHINLGYSYALQKAWAIAEQQYNQAIDILSKAGVLDKIFFFEAHAGLAYVYWKTHRFAQAKSLYESGLEVVRGSLPPTHPIRVRWEQEYQGALNELAR